MSGRTTQDRSVSVLIEAVRIAISSLRTLATSLERALDRFEGSERESVQPPRSSAGSQSTEWDLVPEGQNGSVSQGERDSFEEVARGLAECPQSCIAICSPLGSEAAARARRAWSAG